MFGGLGILAGSAHNWACIPLCIRFHDGLQAAREWKGAAVSKPSEMAFVSHVVQMVEDAYYAAFTFGDSLLLLDKYLLPARILIMERTLMTAMGQMMVNFRKYFFRLLGENPELRITRIIQGLQEEPEEHWDSLAS